MIIKEENGWEKTSIDDVTFFFKGFLLDKDLTKDMEYVAEELRKHSFDVEALCEWAGSLRGHFALVAYRDNVFFAIVDKDRSIPLYYTNDKEGTVHIAASAKVLLKELKYDVADVDDQAALEFAMSGYTIGKKTIHNRIFQMVAGECLYCTGSLLKIKNYYVYRPWMVRDQSVKSLKSDFSEVTWHVFKDMVSSVSGRQVVVPLSAGNDSRLVVSMLKEHGYKDVLCVSYGREGNFEAKAAKEIAERLGYEWRFIPLSTRIQKKSFSQYQFHEYLDYTDNLSNGAVLIDYSAVNVLSSSGVVDDHAVFVNGNSGDFISGAHIQSYMKDSEDGNVQSMLSNYIDKHYSLWRCLKTKKNRESIAKQIALQVNSLMDNHNIPYDKIWAVGEYLEWIGRQTKLVSATQRSYEFHGYDWRLPLWDPLFMDFWEGVPKEYKVNQKLYKDALYENNWAGVWRDIKVNDYAIPSSLLRFTRLMTKLPFSILGKDRWHEFDKRVFGYFLDNTAATAFVPYLDTVYDMCGARNRNSWVVKVYLKKYGIDMFDMRQTRSL